MKTHQHMTCDLKEVASENNQVVGEIRSTSNNLGASKKTDIFKAASQATKWRNNVKTLGHNLQKQRFVLKSLEDNMHQENDGIASANLCNYFFQIIESLKSDARQMFQDLHEFVELAGDDASDPSSASDWPAVTQEFETYTEQIASTTSERGALEMLQAVIKLINVREYFAVLFMQSLLFQKAVLDYDLGFKRDYCGVGMKEAWDVIIDHHLKGSVVPARHQCVLPLAFEGSPSVLLKEENQKAFGTNVNKKETTKENEEERKTLIHPFRLRFVELMREMSELDKNCRNSCMMGDALLKSGSTANKSNGEPENVEAGDLRREYADLWKKFQNLQNDIQVLKATKHTHQAELVHVQNLQERLENERNKTTNLLREKGELHSRYQFLRNEKQDLTSKLQELSERFNKTAASNAPKLEKLEEIVQSTQESLDTMEADAQLLCSMYKNQVKKNSEQTERYQKIESDLKLLQSQLQQERFHCNSLKEEMQKKDQLILRTMAAKESIQAAYTDGKKSIRESKEAEFQAEKRVQQLKDVLMERDQQIEEMQKCLGRASSQINEFEEEKTFSQLKFQELSVHIPLQAAPPIDNIETEAKSLEPE